MMKSEFSVEEGASTPPPSGNPPPTRCLEVGVLPSAHADKTVRLLSGKKITKILKICTLVFCLTILCTVMNASGTNQNLKIEAYVYDPCGGCFSEGLPCRPCTVVIEMEQYLNSKLQFSKNQKKYSLYIGNTLLTEAKEKLLRRIGVATEVYPIVFVNDKVMYGWEEIKTTLPKLMGTSDERTAFDPNLDFRFQRGDRDLFVYFGIPSCSQCKQTETLFNDIKPKGYQAERVTYDASVDNYIFELYCREYDLDSTATYVPIIFIGDSVLEGYDEIEMFLESYIEHGYGQRTPYF